MARGWESKSIEAQQADASERTARPAKPLSPDQQARRRRTEGLQLDRTRILQQLEAATKAQHRQMLEEALAELNRRLGDLG